MKPALLFLEVLPDIKGGQQMLLEIVPALADYELHAIVPGAGALQDALVGLGVMCHTVPMHQYTLVRKGPGDIFAFARELGHLSCEVARISRECSARLIWANSTRAFVWGTRGAHLARVPIIWHAQNLLADRKSLWLSQACARSRAVKRIVGCSTRAAAQYARPEKAAIVPLAADLARYAPSIETRREMRDLLGIPGDQFVVIQVGDLIPLKGQSLLMEAARETPDVMYLIVGDAREDQEESVAYASELRKGAGANVRFLGRRTDVPRLLNAADAMAITSTREAGPRVLVEGLATGLPVVSTWVGMAPEVISPGVNGHLTEPDPHKLAAIIRDMARTPEHSRQMSRNARLFAEQALSIEHYRDQIRSLVQVVLSEST